MCAIKGIKIEAFHFLEFVKGKKYTNEKKT